MHSSSSISVEKVRRRRSLSTPSGSAAAGSPSDYRRAQPVSVAPAFVVPRAPAQRAGRRSFFPAAVRAASIDELGVAEHPAFLIERAQLLRIDFHEHAARLHHFRIELDGDAPFAVDEL